MDDKPFAIDRKDLIEGLGKGLRVIEAFDDEHPRLTPSKLAGRAGITRTAARRYLLSLAHFGYAATDGKQFWLQPRVLGLGRSYLAAARLPGLVQPVAQRVSAQTGETVNFSVLDGHEVLHLVRSNAPRFISLGYEVGVRVPAHLLSSGVAALANWSDDAVGRWIDAHDFASPAAESPMDPSKFRQIVANARSLGYAATQQQLDPRLRGISVALLDRLGETHGALGITVQAQSYAAEAMVERLLPALQDAASGLRSLL